MGASGGRPAAVTGYPVRLDAEQSVAVHGFARARGTLRWEDFGRGLTLRRCLDVGIPAAKLHRMQPDVAEWVAAGAATLFDCEAMALWAPDPFEHFGCQLGMLVLHRARLPASILIRAGVTVARLVARHGLNGELMAMLHYAPEDWLALGLQAEHAALLSDAQWRRVFGELGRDELQARLPATPPRPPPAACSPAASSP